MKILNDLKQNDILGTDMHTRFAKERRSMGKSLKGTELGTGIVQRSDGVYQGSFVDDYGKRKYVYSKNLQTLKKKLKSALANGMTKDSRSNVTLDKWFDICMTTFKPHVRNTSKRTYVNQYALVRSDLGDMRLSDISLLHVQRALNKLSSDASRKHVKALLTDIFGKAIDAGIIQKNPADGAIIKITCDESKGIRILSDKEIEDITGVMSNSKTFSPIFIVALDTGMRVGEILGLCISDVDFERHVIYIRHTLVYLPNNGSPIYELHEPKTQAGKRVIPMSKRAEDVIRSCIEKKEENHNTPKAGLEDLIFVSRSNLPLNESNVRKMLQHYAEEVGVHGLTMHALRHTFATKCIAHGMNPKTLQAILGHASYQITVDRYCHVEEHSLKDEMGLIFSMA